MEIFTKDEAYDDRKFPATSKRKRRFKTTEEGVTEMCEIIEKNRLEERVDTVKEMIKAGLTTLAAVKASGLYTEKEIAAISAP